MTAGSCKFVGIYLLLAIIMAASRTIHQPMPSPTEHPGTGKLLKINNTV